MNEQQNNKEVAVLVTTQHRGVFFGYTSDNLKEPHLMMRRVRNCLTWSASVKGFIGLAAAGPNAECKVGPGADGVIRDVTSVLLCTEEAVAAWESAPWAE